MTIDGPPGLEPRPATLATPSPPDEIRPPALESPRYLLALVLFVATLLATITLGAAFTITVRTDQLIVTRLPLPLLLTNGLIEAVWSHRAALAQGLSFAIPLLFILLCHELGHYVLCRRHRLPSTAPLFLPAPFGVGTLGAFIRIRAPIRDKRQLLDVGAGGPIAGFVALLPFLFHGVALSTPATVEIVNRDMGSWLLRPGNSLLMEIATRLFHGELPPGTLLNLHPFALAAWGGLLATSANLLPIGQLDGGHILYAVAGRRQRPVARTLWVLMAGAGFWWPGWWLLSLLVLIFGLRHPPVLDETVELDSGRRWVAWACLAILALCIMPVPLDVLFLAP